MKKDKKNYEINMCSGSILKNMLMFAIPLMFSSMLQLLFNAADIIVVGRFAGDHALAAVGSNTALIGLMTNLFVGLSIGANVLAARLYGAKQKEELNDAVHTAMTLSVISGIILTLIGIPMAKQILTWMHTPAEVLDLAAVYLRIYFSGMTAMMIYNFGGSLLRALGDTRRPLYYLAIAGVMNVVLNLIFVAGFHMSVAGVGIATVISQCFSAFLIVRCLLKEEGELKLELRRLGLVKKELVWILRVGLPAGIQNTIFDISNVVIQSSINIFGAVVVAANSASESIENFVFFSLMAFNQAIMAFVGQNVGGGQIKRVNRGLLTGIVCETVCALSLGALILMFKEPLLGIYSSNPEVIAEGVKRLEIIVFTYPLCGIMDSFVCAMRGMGYSVVPTIVSMLGACGLRLVWLATIFQIEQFHQVTTIYAAYPVTWTITLIAQLICYLIVKKRVERSLETIKTA